MDTLWSEQEGERVGEDPPKRRWSKEHPPDLSNELTVVINGSSSAVLRGPGNILLGEDGPPAQGGELLQRKCAIGGRPLSVVNMLDLLNAEMPHRTLEELAQQYDTACPNGVNIFLLTVPLGHVSEEGGTGIECLRKAFGATALEFAVVLLTYQQEQREILPELLQGGDTELLLEGFQDRFATCRWSMDDLGEVEQLMEKMELALRGFSQPCYTRAMYQEACLQAWLGEIEGIVSQKREEEEKIVTELKMLMNDNNKRIQELTDDLGCPNHAASLQMIIVGRTGAGKSTTGNLILGREAFHHEAGKTAITDACRVDTETVDGRPVTVLDTPGLHKTDNSHSEVIKDIKHSCDRFLDSGPLAILLVVSLECFGEDDLDVFRIIIEMFGQASQRDILPIFSHGGHVEDGEELLQHGGKDLQWLVQQCGGRYHLLSTMERGGHAWVTELLEKVEEMMLVNAGDCYTTELQDTSISFIEEENWITELRENLKTQKTKMGEKKEELERERMLISEREESIEALKDLLRNSERMLKGCKEHVNELKMELVNLKANMKEVLDLKERLQRERDEAEEDMQRKREDIRREKEANMTEKQKLEEGEKELKRKMKDIKERQEIMQREREEILEEFKNNIQSIENERKQLLEKQYMIERREEATEGVLKMIATKTSEIKVTDEQRKKLWDEIQGKGVELKGGENDVIAQVQNIDSYKLQIEQDTGEILLMQELFEDKERLYAKMRTDFNLREDEIERYASRLSTLWQETAMRKRENERLMLELKRQSREIKRKDALIQMYKDTENRLEEELTLREREHKRERERDTEEIQGYMEELRRLRKESLCKDSAKESGLRENAPDIKRYQEEARELRVKDGGIRGLTKQGYSEEGEVERQKKETEMTMIDSSRETPEVKAFAMGDKFVTACRENLHLLESKSMKYKEAEEARRQERRRQFKGQMETLRRTLMEQ